MRVMPRAKNGGGCEVNGFLSARPLAELGDEAIAWSARRMGRVFENFAALKFWRLPPYALGLCWLGGRHRVQDLDFGTAVPLELEEGSEAAIETLLFVGEFPVADEVDRVQLASFEKLAYLRLPVLTGNARSLGPVWRDALTLLPKQEVGEQEITLSGFVEFCLSWHRLLFG